MRARHAASLDSAPTQSGREALLLTGISAAMILPLLYSSGTHGVVVVVMLLIYASVSQTLHLQRARQRLDALEERVTTLESDIARERMTAPRG